MRRREFIAGLAAFCAAGASPVLRARVALAQRWPVVGYLSPRRQGGEIRQFENLRDGLKQMGFVEGGNLSIERRWANDDNARLPDLAADLVGRKVAVIITRGLQATRAAKAATDSISIVFGFGGDPVALGLVSSLARPGANVTGVTQLDDEVAPKRLEMMHDLLPTATDFGLLVDPSDPNNELQSNDMRAAARVLGLNLHILPAASERDFATVFERAVRLRAAGLIISPNSLTTSLGAAGNQQLASLAARHAMPTISFWREFTLAGGLMSYGVGDPTELVRLVGVYTGRILRGEKPADLPVQQATRIEFALNRKTAKALGLTIPETLLATADEVIQ
jgi:putative tryptophan/tyrosine transport system substrate-binding protein